MKYQREHKEGDKSSHDFPSQRASTRPFQSIRIASDALLARTAWHDIKIGQDRSEGVERFTRSVTQEIAALREFD